MGANPRPTSPVYRTTDSDRPRPRPIGVRSTLRSTALATRLVNQKPYPRDMPERSRRQMGGRSS
jgi:hypothetical protein